MRARGPDPLSCPSTFLQNVVLTLRETWIDLDLRNECIARMEIAVPVSPPVFKSTVDIVRYILEVAYIAAAVGESDDGWDVERPLHVSSPEVGLQRVDKFV
jgi:hypothetical protein